MMSSAPSSQPMRAPGARAGLMRLRRLAAAAPATHRCELCSAAIAEEHPHLLELANRQLHCACQACAILFSDEQGQRYRRVLPVLQRVAELQSIDGLWERLHLPIHLAFVYRSSMENRVRAFYPSPAGAIESLLPSESWDELLAQVPALARMQCEVEALLINQTRRRRDAFVVSIDQCFRLVGLIRSQWRGFSGGSEVWKSIDGFFDALHRRADRAEHPPAGTGKANHA